MLPTSYHAKSIMFSIWNYCQRKNSLSSLFSLRHFQSGPSCICSWTFVLKFSMFSKHESNSWKSTHHHEHKVCKHVLFCIVCITIAPSQLSHIKYGRPFKFRPIVDDRAWQSSECRNHHVLYDWDWFECSFNHWFAARFSSSFASEGAARLYISFDIVLWDAYGFGYPWTLGIPWHEPSTGSRFARNCIRPRWR